MKTMHSILAQAGAFLAPLLLATAPAFGQSTNQITAVSPASATQGTTNLLVTFTLNATPPPPPTSVSVTSASIGTNAGTALTHPTQTSVTATFNIPGNAPLGAQDVTLVFPGGVYYVKTGGFTNTAATTLTADFTAAPTNGNAPLMTVNFSDASTGTVTNRLWNFGDDSTSTATNPVHTYNTAGSYTVSLNVFGPLGSNTLTRSGYITVAAAPPDGAFITVDTGQTNCYNDNGAVISPAPATNNVYYGQDAQFYGNQPGYTNNGDGTITDLNTGLMWVQARGSNQVTWAAAVSNAATCTVGGYSDWRMPTIKELYSLIEYTGANGQSFTSTAGYIPFIDTNYFGFAYGPGTSTTVGDRVIDCQDWSATPYVSTTMDGAATIFGVNFSDGRLKGYPLYNPANNTSAQTNYVRYVRGNTNYGVNSFTNNGDGTISDLATGLMWSQDDSGAGLSWTNALVWVQAKNASNYLGHGDWRLPNAKELHTILDYTRSPDTTASAAINPVFNCTGITNEAGQPDFPWFWSGTTLLDGSPADSGIYVCFGRAMGYMGSGLGWVDAHGAGAIRSDPKDVSLTNYTYTPYGYYNSNAPQGDAVRIYNYVRLVRGGDNSSIDHVGDGIPDWWRRQYFGGSGTTTNAASCASCDPDHDGVSNYYEYIANTNPTNALSYFYIQSVTNTAGFTVFYQSSASRDYTLYYTTNLTSGVWTPVSSQTNIPGSGGTDSLSDTNTGSVQRFYRIGVALP
jgi:PKD repeat protein